MLLKCYTKNGHGGGRKRTGAKESPQNPFTQKCELPCDLDLRAVVENEGDLADSVEKHSFSVKTLCVLFSFLEICSFNFIV